MLRNAVRATCFGISLAFVSVSAQAQGMPDGAYAGAGFAMQSVDISGYDDGQALFVRAGMPMESVHENFSIEGEFTQTMSPASYDVTYSSGASYTYEISLMTFAGYAKYAHPVTDAIQVNARVGYLYEDATVDYEDSAGNSASGSDSETGLSYGIGASYNVTEKVSAEVDYTIIEDDVAHMGIGATYSF